MSFSYHLTLDHDSQKSASLFATLDTIVETPSAEMIAQFRQVEHEAQGCLIFSQSSAQEVSGLLISEDGSKTTSARVHYSASALLIPPRSGLSPKVSLSVDSSQIGEISTLDTPTQWMWERGIISAAITGKSEAEVEYKKALMEDILTEITWESARRRCPQLEAFWRFDRENITQITDSVNRLRLRRKIDVRLPRHDREFIAKVLSEVETRPLTAFAGWGGVKLPSDGGFELEYKTIASRFGDESIVDIWEPIAHREERVKRSVAPLTAR